MNYHHANGHASENLPAYDFRKDFSTIAKPGLHRYLDAIGAPPDNGDWVNLRWYPARQYVRHLWNGLNHIQRNYHEFGRSCDTEIYDIKHWTRESVTAYVEARLEDILTSIEPEEPIDVYRAVHLGTEMAREQGYACEPEAIAYTADRLKSKIERDAVYNPVTTAHDGILTYYQWVKPQAERRRAQGRGDGKVVYIDRYKQRREAREAKQKQEQEHGLQR